MEIKELVDPLTTLLATFLGAWLAFLVERRKGREQEEQVNFGAANQAIYTIYDYWNGLEQFRKECIEPHRGKPDAWLNMSISPTNTFGIVRLNAGSLSFLLQNGKAETYANVMLEEHRYQHATNLIELRTSIILNEVHPRIAAAGIKVGGSTTEEDLEKIIGIDTVHKLKVITAAVIQCVDEDLKSLEAAHNQLRAVVSELYPNKKPIRIEFKAGPSKA